MISLNLSSVTRWGINFLALLGVIVAMHLGYSVMIPTIIALLLASMLWPIAWFLNQTMRLPWSFACLTVVLGMVFINLLFTMGIFLAIPRFVQGLPGPNDIHAQKEIYNKFRNQVQKISPVPVEEDYLPEDPERSAVFQYVKESLKAPFITDALLQVAFYANVWLWQWVLIMFILLFLLLEGPMLTRRVVEIFGPSSESQAQAVLALADMAHHVRSYLVWRTIINFGLALLVGVVYSWFHLKQPWTWAILTAFLCYVPYLGPIAAGVPPVLDAFLTNDSPWVAIYVFLFYLAVITAEGYLLIPLVMGRTMELNATTVLLACLFWELVWGLPGLFLAMPLMSGLKAIFSHVPEGQPWANLMSTHKAEAVMSRAEMAKAAAIMDETEIIMPEEEDTIQKGQNRKTSS